MVQVEGKEQYQELQPAWVYVLCKSGKALPAQVNPLDPDIIYFGETCSRKGLRHRWQKFDDAAFGQKKGKHSGGSSCKRKFHGDKGLELYVAAMPVLPEKKMKKRKVRDSYIRFAERKLILDYALEHEKTPECNSK